MKLQHIKAALLTLDNGESVHVELIGKGRFSEAWKNGANVYVVTRERASGTDYSKRIIEAMQSTNPHIPKIELIGELSNDRSDVFKMPLYQPLTAKSKAAWAQFKELERLRTQAWGTAFKREWNKPLNVYDAVIFCEDFAGLVEESEAFPDTLKEAIRELADECRERSTWVMEIAKRNLCIDSDGRLILLDCIFDLELLHQQMEAKRKQHRGW